MAPYSSLFISLRLMIYSCMHLLTPPEAPCTGKALYEAQWTLSDYTESQLDGRGGAITRGCHSPERQAKPRMLTYARPELPFPATEPLSDHKDH